MADFITNDLVLSESPSTGYSRQRKCFFHSEIFMLRSYNFLHNARPLARRNRSAPPISTPAWGIFPPPPRHPTRTPTHKRSTNEKKRCTFSTNVSTFGENSTAFFSPRATTLFPFRHSSRAWARSLAHALSEFSFFAFTARRFAHNPLITSGLCVKPSPYFLHNISSITHSTTIFCGEGRGEGKNPKKGEGKQGEAFTRISLFDNNLRPNGEEVKAKNRKIADARVRARCLVFHRRRALPNRHAQHRKYETSTQGCSRHSREFGGGDTQLHRLRQ